MGTRIDFIIECLKDGPMTCEEITERYIKQRAPNADHKKEFHNFRCALYTLRKQRFVKDSSIAYVRYWMLI